MFPSLPQGTLVVGATQMPFSIFHASELGAELVKGGWAGPDALQQLRCRYASPIERLPIRQKGQLHPAHWASPDLGQTQFEHMDLKCFSWGPVRFCFSNSSSVYCQHGTKQTVCWMPGDFLTMTPFWTRRFMYTVDSSILQIASFPCKRLSLLATVLLVLPPLKTRESGCLLPYCRTRFALEQPAAQASWMF